MRLIDADALKYHRQYRVGKPVEYLGKIDIDLAPTIDPDSLRLKGHWIWKHRYRGGFRQRKGYDAEGNFHIINVDESYEIDDPYCSECGMLNESIFLNFCPNCGADMRGNLNA